MSYCGLDFGTSNSALAIVRQGNIEVAHVDPSALSPQTLRSLLYFAEDKRSFVGQEAIAAYIGESASGRLMQSIKTFLPYQDLEATVINGKPYSLIRLIAFLIRSIKERAETEIGKPLTDVVLGRPAKFDDEPALDELAQTRLLQAAEMAGFKRISFELEPIAAALSYEESLPLGQSKIVLVGDFGGGTSDFTVIRLNNKPEGHRDRTSDVLGVSGVSVGGDVFDSRIMLGKLGKYFGQGSRYRNYTGELLEIPQSFYHTLSHWHLIPRLREKKTREWIGQIQPRSDNPLAIGNLANLIDDNFGFMLFQSIEEAKCELSVKDSAGIKFVERTLRIDEVITRQEFEGLLVSDLSQIDRCISDVLQQSQLTGAQVDAVFLTGGSSQIPAVRDIFTKYCGEEKFASGNAFTSVVQGLAKKASEIYG